MQRPAEVVDRGEKVGVVKLPGRGIGELRLADHLVVVLVELLEEQVVFIDVSVAVAVGVPGGGGGRPLVGVGSADAPVVAR